MEGTKIIRLEAANVKRIRAVEITPDGAVVLVTGRNAQGKSSVLDAIIYALGGKDAIPEQPLRDGADAGYIKLDLGDIIVERTFTADNTYLKVRAAGTNAEYPTPQKLLDGLVGKIAFDPLAFARMKAKDQLTALLEVVDLGGLDLAKLAGDRQTLYERRTEANREIKRLKGALATLPHYDEAPAAVVPAGELAQQVADGERINAERQRAADRLNAIARQITDLKAEAETLTGVVAREPVDVAALKDRLASAEADNDKARANGRYLVAVGEFDTAKAAADKLDDDLKALDARKAAALAAATFPVAGLSFDDDQVFYDGRPLEQASSAELTRISTAVAMAANPKLKVILIKDGSLLDDENLRVIAEMAAANDYQVWIEKVDASGEVGVVIEDGMVASVAAGVK